jgi:glc operon protein GlcG
MVTANNELHAVVSQVPKAFFPFLNRAVPDCEVAQPHLRFGQQTLPLFYRRRIGRALHFDNRQLMMGIFMSAVEVHRLGGVLALQDTAAFPAKKLGIEMMGAFDVAHRNHEMVHMRSALRAFYWLCHDDILRALALDRSGPTGERMAARYSPAMADLIESKTVSLAGFAMCICVVDTAGEPVVAVRMDGAPRLSASIAADKAWTVTSFAGMPTSAWWGAIKDDPTLVHGITNTPRLIIFGGGEPLMVDGQLVGAIGVSGGTSEQDADIAQAAAAALT